MQSKPLSVPSVIVRIRRVDLVALNACESGLAAFDRIACMQGNPTRVRFRATRTSAARTSAADLRGADLRGVYWIKSRPAPDGWTHDPPAAHCEWVVLRRSL